MHPTPFPEINTLLEILFTGVKEILTDKFFGMYLFGSLASGDFNEHTSDVDFVIVTGTVIPEDQLQKLRDFINQLAASDNPWIKKLEGSFIPASDFKNPVPDRQYPSINIGGNFAFDNKDITSPVPRQMLREHGITLFGPDPKSFIDPVPEQDLKRATLDTLHSWWEPMLADSARLQDRQYQAYAVLTMCRMLYTLKNGGIISKPAGAKWAKDTLDTKWKGLIDRALMRADGDGINDLFETQEFIKYTLSNA